MAVGGDAPITVQSMTITKTADVEGTLQQIYALAAAGCDIVRCTCNEAEAAEGLAQIVPRSPMPIIADIHHQYRMALAAMEAGVHGLRLNPGNIRRPEHIKAVASEARDRGVPIRIGVNGGSLDPELYEKYGGVVTAEAMVESAMTEIAYFQEVGFDDVKISVKASSVPLMVEAYRQLSAVTDHPLHLGVTEAGPPPAGLVKATAGIATLLLEGIGDTIRYSLTADPVEEARAGRQLLEALGLRERKNVDLIACPSCGRAEIDVIDVANRAMEAFGDRKIPLQVAVMGCVVNGPGEAREADLGIAAGNKRGHLFVKGRNVAVVPEAEMVEALVEWAEFINEHGIEAAIARVDTAKAEREAAKDRAVLLDAKGADANHAAERIVEIRKTVHPLLNSARARSSNLVTHVPPISRTSSDQIRPLRRRVTRWRRSRLRRGDVRGHAGRDLEVVAGREVAGHPGVGDHELVGLGPALGRAHEAQQADRRVGERVHPRLGHHRVHQRRRIHHLEQRVDVDRLVGETGAHDVVARTHQLDAGTAEVGVEVARPELQRLTRIELHVVEQQRDDDARIAGIARGEARRPARLGAVAVGAGVDDAEARQSPAQQTVDRGADAVALDHRRQRHGLGRVELLEERGRLVQRPHPAERLEAGERAQQLGLRVRVRVAAHLVAGLGLVGVGVGLQRQRLGRGQHLEQVRQRAGDVGQRLAAGPRAEHRRTTRVRAEPELGPWQPVGRAAEQVRDELPVAPRIVLDDSSDWLHR